MPSKKPKRIIHFRSKCIGCGMCAYLSPDYFEMSAVDGLATLKDSKQVKDTSQRNIIPGDENKNEEAAKGCPVRIIKVV